MNRIMANRERRLRKSQLITPYGIGAVVEFPNETLMHAGINAYDESKKKGRCKTTKIF